MEKIYFTIAGTKHHYGQEFFGAKQEVKLIKEPDNEFDKEAIKVEMVFVSGKQLFERNVQIEIDEISKIVIPIHTGDEGQRPDV